MIGFAGDDVGRLQQHDMIKFQTLGEGRRNQDGLQLRSYPRIRALGSYSRLEDLRILAEYVVVDLPTVQQSPNARHRGVRDDHSHRAFVLGGLVDRLGKLIADPSGKAQIELAT